MKVCTFIFFGIFIILRISVSDASSSSISESKWTTRSLTVNKGDHVSLTCVTSHARPHDVITVSRMLDTQTLTVCDGAILRSPFSSMSRFSAEYNHTKDSITITLNIDGAKSEDSALYGCYHSYNPDTLDFINVTVKAPVSDMYMATITPDGDEVPSYDGYVMLNEHERLGISCVATVEGSLIHPDMTVSVDGKDVTNLFTLTRETLTVTIESGLLIHYTQTRLTLMTSAPNPDFNTKRIDCHARQPGFESPVSTSATLTIYFSPILKCAENRFVARPGDTVSLNCTVKANPGSRVMWISARQHDSDQVLYIREQDVINDVTYLELLIRPTKREHFHQYTIRADNVIGTVRFTIELEENTLDRSDPNKQATRHDEPTQLSSEIDSSQYEVETLVFDHEAYVITTHKSVAGEAILATTTTISDMVGNKTHLNSTFSQYTTTTSSYSQSSDIQRHLHADDEHFNGITKPLATDSSNAGRVFDNEDITDKENIMHPLPEESETEVIDEDEDLKSIEQDQAAISNIDTVHDERKDEQKTLHQNSNEELLFSNAENGQPSYREMNIYDVGQIDVVEQHEFEIDSSFYSPDDARNAFTPPKVTPSVNTKSHNRDVGHEITEERNGEQNKGRIHGHQGDGKQHQEQVHHNHMIDRHNDDQNVSDRRNEFSGTLENTQQNTHRRLDGDDNRDTHKERIADFQSETGKSNNNTHWHVGDSKINQVDMTDHRDDATSTDHISTDQNIEQSSRNHRRKDEKHRKKDRKEAKEQRRKVKEEEKRNRQDHEDNVTQAFSDDHKSITNDDHQQMTNDHKPMMHRDTQSTRESRDQKDKSRAKSRDKLPANQQANSFEQTEVSRNTETEVEKEIEWNNRDLSDTSEDNKEHTEHTDMRNTDGDSYYDYKNDNRGQLVFSMSHRNSHSAFSIACMCLVVLYFIAK